MKQNKEKGFTLVELLVVVAIIGILAAIVLVSLNSARDRARVGALQATMASATTLAALCANDSGVVQSPTDPTTGAGPICDPTTITDEEWPALNGQSLAGGGYTYGTADNDTITALNEDLTIAITCTVATGSCVRGE